MGFVALDRQAVKVLDLTPFQAHHRREEARFPQGRNASPNPARSRLRGDGDRVVIGIVLVHRRGIPAGVGHGFAGALRGVGQVHGIVFVADADLVVCRVGNAHVGGVAGCCLQDQSWLGLAPRPVVTSELQFANVPLACGPVVGALADVENRCPGGQAGYLRALHGVRSVVDGYYRHRVLIGSDVRIGAAILHREIRHRPDVENVGPRASIFHIIGGIGVSVVVMCGSNSISHLIGAEFLKLASQFIRPITRRTNVPPGPSCCTPLVVIQQSFEGTIEMSFVKVAIFIQHLIRHTIANIEPSLVFAGECLESEFDRCLPGNYVSTIDAVCIGIVFPCHCSAIRDMDQRCLRHQR